MCDVEVNFIFFSIKCTYFVSFFFFYACLGLVSMLILARLNNVLGWTTTRFFCVCVFAANRD